METFFYEHTSKLDDAKVGFEVRSIVDLSADELEMLKIAGLDDLAPIEAWTALGTNTQINYSTHGIFRYYGKFPSPVASYLILKYSNENSIIMDPMSGSGTTALECLLLGRKCISFDVNPLSLLLAKVKITYIDKEVLTYELDKLSNNYSPCTINEFNYCPVGLKNVDHWFLETTQNSIRGLLREINKISDSQVRDFFMIVLMSTIRYVSKATSQQGRLFLDVLSAKEDALETFLKKAQKAIISVSSLPKSNDNIKIDYHDINKPLKAINNDLIILHPPYFNSYKYSSVNSLELSWLGVDHASIRKQEIREFFKVGKAEKVSFYIEDMVHSLLNTSMTLSENGVLALMIGDTIIKGEYIKVTRQLIDEFLKRNQNIKIEKIALRVPKYTEASWAASQRRKSDSIGANLYDFIIIFRKEKQI